MNYTLSLLLPLITTLVIQASQSRTPQEIRDKNIEQALIACHKLQERMLKKYNHLYDTRQHNTPAMQYIAVLVEKNQTLMTQK